MQFFREEENLLRRRTMAHDSIVVRLRKIEGEIKGGPGSSSWDKLADEDATSMHVGGAMRLERDEWVEQLDTLIERIRPHSD